MSHLHRTTPMTARGWDVIVVGAGHNGLACAAYLARAGCSVLVLEARERIGGACTLERPFADQDFVVSPCAYVVGLLHPLVIEELGLPAHDYHVHRIDPHLWCPFEDGSSLTLWDDAARNRVEVARLSERDVEGFARYELLFARIRDALRHGPHDTWVGEAPDHEAIEELLGDDKELIDVLFEDSIADVVERHVVDERLRTALYGQGLIGTWAGPRDAGTAAIHAFHSMGTLEGRGGSWGYVQGGMGMVSNALAAAAEAAGADIVTGTPVTRISPNEGVVLQNGDRIESAAVVSNADPRTTLELCASDADPTFASRVAGWRMEGPVIKLNCALSRLPRFRASTDRVAPHRAMVTIARTIDESQAAYERSRNGVAAPTWAELYFHTAYDASVAPRAQHVMSVFAQFVPYQLHDSTWDEARDVVADSAIAEIERFAPDVRECIVERQVLAPPDIEAHVGLRGGHIFQGECLPDQMWDRRFAPRTPMRAVYMCGAATHPGGSVIAVNGRNAAQAVLADLRGAQPAGQAMSAS